MKKKAILLALAMVMLISACGKTGTAQNVPEGSQPAASAPGSQSTPAPQTDSELSFTGWGDENGDYVIDGCESYEEVITVPAKIDEGAVVGIDEFAFANARDYCKVIELPDGVKFIGMGAFMNCMYLEQIRIGSGLERIDDLAFFGCDSLRTLVLPEGLKTIGDSFPISNKVLEDVVIPASVTEMSIGVAQSLETCPNAVIVTPAGSYAESYAKEHGLTYRNG